MPSSLIIVALVVAWLVVLVPMIVRKRQEIARTADSALAARVVRSAEDAAEDPMRTAEPAVDSLDDSAELADGQPEPEREDPGERDYDRADERDHEAPPFETAPRAYRPGRGGFDPETAAVIARAKYGFRQRIVLAMLVGAVVSAGLAVVVFPMLWWPHGVIDLTLVTYLGYLRRQVRIEQEIRERRLARMRSAARIRAYQRSAESEAGAAGSEEAITPTPAPLPPPRPTYPGATIVDVDDEDPAFDELDRPANLPYRRAAGE
ncbi:MAG: gephyrin-like molybdotransferase receptor GlpR [Labedaea sp.]